MRQKNLWHGRNTRGHPFQSVTGEEYVLGSRDVECTPEALLTLVFTFCLLKIKKKKKKQYIVKSISQYISVCACVGGLCSVAQSCPTCDIMDSRPPGSSVRGDFPGKNTGVGCHFLLQGIFWTQRSNLHLLHWQMDFLPLSYLGSPLLFICVYIYIYVCVYIYIYIYKMKYIELSRSILILHLIKYSTKVIVFCFYAGSNSWIYYLTVNTCLSIYICVNSTCSSAFHVFCSVPCNIRESILTLASGNLNFTPFLPSHDFK